MFYLCGRNSDRKNKLDQLKYEIMIISMLKNLNHINSSHYIIKFVDFMSIYYVMNLNIVSLFMVFRNLYLRSIDLLQI